MQKLLKDYLDDFNKKQKKNRRAAVAAVLLVVMVVGSVLNILTQYGVAMTGAPACGLEEHTHGENCYASVLSCGQEETEGHTHTGDCLYPEELVCSEEEGEEHTHSDGCYAAPDGYACGLDESEGHTHFDGCYTSELSCGLEEHTHTDGCYIAEEDDVDVSSENTEGKSSQNGNTISEGIGEAGSDEDKKAESDRTNPDNTGAGMDDAVQESGKTEDESKDAEISIEETEEPSEGEEEGPNPEADVESREVWDAQYRDVEWQNIWGEDLATAAKMQVGYEESEENYIVAEDESHKGYTRYGHFADEDGRYVDWDAAFVNFCLHYAGISNSDLFPDETDTAEWRNRFEEMIDEIRGEEENYLTGPGAYEPETGDLVFFHRDEEETEEQMGIVSSWEEETNEIRVIEGNSGNEVRENTYDAADDQISAYLKLTELEAAYKGILTSKEQQQVDAVIALIEALPSPEAIMERFAALEETEDEEGYAAYYLELLGQISTAREAYEALSEKQKAAVLNAEKLQRYEWLLADTMEEEKPVSDFPVYVAHVPVEGSEKGQVVLELLYEDEKSQNDKEGQDNHPGYGFGANIALHTQDIEGTKSELDLTVTIHIPNKYMNPESIRFKPLGETIEHEISDVTEEGEYYNISIHFPKFKISDQMGFPLEMSFYGGIVPKDYELKVYATLTVGSKSDDTGCNIYRPIYSKPNIVKYVNSNQYDSMAKDYTRVSASIGEDGVIKDNNYVSFWYRMGGEKWYMREYDQVTLTDILPTYEKYVRNLDGSIKLDGNGQKMTETATAVFDPAINEGWVSNSDGTVSRVLTTERTCIKPCKEDTFNWRAANHLEEQIAKVELKLQFPDCIIDEVSNDNFLFKDLTNNVEAEFHPHDGSAVETNFKTDDSIIFTLTNQPTGAGFSKYNSSNVVTDIRQVREGLYRWGINLENTESVVPMKAIVLKDFELDERLKIRTLWLNTNDKAEYRADNRIDRIEAETYGGETDIYRAPSSSDESAGPWFVKGSYDYDGLGWHEELTLDPNREYKSFTVYMKENYELKMGENIHIGVFTTFREPDKKQYQPSENRDDPINTYHNSAQAEYWVDNTKFTLTSGNMFSMIDATENIWIEKNIVYEHTVELGEKDKYWNFHIKGSLEDGKDYEDIRIIDLLPEAFTLPKNEKNEFKIESGNGGDRYFKDTLIIENYKNTGRTAVIMYLNADMVKETLGRKDANGNSEVSITLKTEVLPTASLGTCTNDVWLVSKDFDDGETLEALRTAEDIYDMDEDGDTEDLVRVAADYATVNAAKGIMVEKLIAPAEQNTWRRSGLFVGVGDKFRYKLCVSNLLSTTHSGLVVYDVLPVIGDRNISNTGGRDSEYTVKLSGKIPDTAGYQVFYTTSDEVYKHSMTEILGEKDVQPSVTVTWLKQEEITEEILKNVTAFRIVAEEGTKIGPDNRVEFTIPVKVTDTLDEASYKILEKKSSEDRNKGTATYLVSTNSFGYRVDTLGGKNLESNYVNAQIPFAGFVIRKVDAGETNKGLAGAEFRLEKQQSAGAGGNEAESWTSVTGYENVTTGSDGTLSFKNLTEGTYRLTETKAPAGYHLDSTPIPVIITLNRETMEYSITIEGNTHAGNSRDPFAIVNHAVYELPSTGGTGAESYALAGTILMMAAVGLLYRRKVRTEIG